MTKTNTHKPKFFNASLVTLLITVGLFTGGFIARNEYSKKLENAQGTIVTVQNELDECEKDLKETQNELEQIHEDYKLEQEKVDQLTEDLEFVNKELADANNTIDDLKDDEYKLVYMGSFKLTHYCTEKRKHICGTGAGITATGTKVTAGRTIAVDPSVIPYGTKVYIEGYGWRTAEDCGGSVGGKHIDVAVSSHSTALSMGTKNGGVWMLVKNS